MATQKKKHLGRGIQGLIPNKVEQPAADTEQTGGSGDGVLKVPINKIERDKTQPRTNFNEESLDELTESVKQHGILQPLLVQEKNGYYEIVTGERRWRAAQKAGLKEIPVIVREFDDEEKVIVQILENLQRENLNPIEEAQGYKTLKERFSLTDDQISESVSKSRAYITNSMRLLRLDPRVRQMVIDEQLSAGHVRALIPVTDGDKQYELAQAAFDGKMSVREVESMVRKLSKPAKEDKKEDLSQYQVQYDKFADMMAERLSVKVRVNLKDKSSGKLEIDFYNQDDFEKIYEKLK